jgi:hypothetical protein
VSSRECSLALAAALLGTRVDALRRLIERRARLVNGLHEARFDGIRAWKRGRKWAVALGVWLCEGSDGRWLAIDDVAASLNRTSAALRKALQRCKSGGGARELRFGHDVFLARRFARRWRLLKRPTAPAGAPS